MKNKKIELLEEKLLSNTNKNNLVLDSFNLYKTMRKNFYTTIFDDILKSYDLKEKYIKKYNLNLGELYYNIGIIGIYYEKIENDNY